MRRRRATVPLAQSGEWAWGGSLWQMLLVIISNVSFCPCVYVVLDPFPTVTDTQVHRPAVGRDLVLECRPPTSYPTGNIYWGISRPDSNQLKAIDNNDRVVLGYDGIRSTTFKAIFDYRIRIRIHCESRFGFNDKVHSVGIQILFRWILFESPFHLRRDVGDEC